MITLNLLPDIKKEYLKANRIKGMLLAIAFLISVGSIAVVALMALYVLGVQKLQISKSQGLIDQSISVLTETEDLDKIVTVQNQLSALPTLHEGTISAARLFDYLTTLTPVDVSLTNVMIQYSDNLVEIKGNGADFKSVNTFVDTLKNATFDYTDSNGSSVAFSSVVLGSISADEEASFKVKFSYDSKIFDPNIVGVKLKVPNITSTRSQTEKPKSLFETEETQQ